MKQVKLTLTALILCLAATLVAAGSQVHAQTIAVIDLQKVVGSSASGKAAQKEIDKKMKSLKSKFKKEEDALMALQKEIEKKGSAWSEEKKLSKMREYRKMARELQDKQNDANFELNQIRKKKLEPILKNLQKVVERLGKENGYTLILEKNAGILYMDHAIDITDQAIKALNKAMK